MSAAAERWRSGVWRAGADVRLWALCLLVQVLGRGAFYLTYAGQIEGGAGELVAAFLQGARFDSRSAALLALPSLLLGLAASFSAERAARWLERARAVLAAAAVSLTVCFALLGIEYYAEFGEPIGQPIFGFFDDGVGAVAGTAVSGYGALWKLAAALGAAAALIVAHLRTSRRELGVARRLGALPWRGRIVVTVVFVALAVGAARGSFGKRPIERKWAAVTEDPVLNDGVVNPALSLLFAWRDRLKQASLATLHDVLPDGDVRAAAARLYPDRAGARTLDDFLSRTAAGSPGPAPRHVFLIVMESYDSWPLLPEFEALRLSQQLSRLGREGGLHVSAFLPASRATMTSLAALIGGLPDSGVPPQASAGSGRGAFPTAPASIARRLGYTTRAFYGGMVSWNRFLDFCKEQGFDEVYGSGDMERPALSPGTWGVPDGQLFDFVQRTVSDERPSFNLILTTTYHPPYDLDVRALGFPLTQVPAGVPFLESARMNLGILGHLWYADRELGRFVDDAEARLPRSLFAITGDHYGRRYPNGQPSYYERSSVPLVLHGREVLAGRALPEGVAGGHLDLLPTLVELMAPAGFGYHAVGEDLLRARPRHLGFGKGRVIGKDFVLDVATREVHPLPGGPEPSLDAAAIDALARAHDDLRGIGWWRIVHGPQLP